MEHHEEFIGNGPFKAVSVNHNHLTKRPKQIYLRSSGISYSVYF